MKKIALIVAAGSGTRMQSNQPKQFLILHQKPVLYYTIRAFLEAYEDIEFVLVLPEEHIAHGQEIIDGYFDASRFKVCNGGRTRFHSVKNGLELIDEESILFVHDGVRCLASPALIHRCYENALEFGTAIPVVNVSESMRMIIDGASNPIDRKSLVSVQTPQTFHSKLLKSSYNIDFKEQFTDEASVVEAFGLKVHLVHGEQSNIKITTPTDLIIAEALLQKRFESV